MTASTSNNRHCLLWTTSHAEWWTEHLFPVLDQFVDASPGKVNRLSLWGAVVFLIGGSGISIICDPITG
jgi:hypothetical protein